jgi:hypothetical protein
MPMKLHLLIALTICLAACGPATPEKENQKAAEAVIKMLNKHHENTGMYPERLDELDFGSDRPAIEARHYNYYRIDSDNFSLQFFFQDQGTKTCTYESKDKSWSCAPG